MALKIWTLLHKIKVTHSVNIKNSMKMQELFILRKATEYTSY